MARDGAFAIRSHVLARPPHFAVKVEYRRGKDVYDSEVVHMAISGEPRARD